MDKAKIDELNRALKLLAEVCEEHVATAKQHREIAKALHFVANSLEELLKKEEKLENKTDG